MNLLRSIVIMLSLYTKIPMPFIEWDGENRKNVLTVLSLAGAVAGLFEAAWAWLAFFLDFKAAFYAAGACLIPALVTGGIHMDGLSDTEDARASHAGPERRQQILADPHMGAFGALAIVLYELFCFALYWTIYDSGASGLDFSLPWMLFAVFTASRAMAQLGIATIKPARDEGMLYTFSSVTNKPAMIAVSLAVLASCVLILVWVQGLPALLCGAALVLLFLYFRHMAVREFGGISGDLCGWIIEMTIPVMLTAAAVAIRLV